MLSSNLSDGEDWIFERILEAGDPGIVDDAHSIIYDYAGVIVIRAQYIVRKKLIKKEGEDEISLPLFILSRRG